MTSRNKTLFLTQFSMLLAIEALFCFTPLGNIPIGPIVATLAGVPVVITGILFGARVGAVMGAFTGLFSLIVMSIMPTNPVMAFVFSPFYTLGPFQGNFFSLLICIVPRVLIGAFAGWTSRFFYKSNHKFLREASYSLGGIAGSFFANTVLVLAGIYFFFGRQLAEALGMEYAALLGGVIGYTVLTNGIAEAVICAVAARLVCVPVKKYLLKQETKPDGK